jgi:hypothetical protein
MGGVCSMRGEMIILVKGVLFGVNKHFEGIFRHISNDDVGRATKETSNTKMISEATMTSEVVVVTM